MDSVQHQKAAKERYPEYFGISHFVIEQVAEWLHKSGMPQVQSALDIVKLSSLTRGFNLYRAINLLLETDHWEDAAILARSMFELVLNIEKILTDGQSREAKARKYLRFGQLQRYLKVRTKTEYEIERGRASQDKRARLAKLEEQADFLFAEFRTKGKKPKWIRSWCGKNVFELAKDSTYPLRLAHYRVVYSLYSWLSHSSPYATMTAFSLTKEKAPCSAEELFQRLEQSDKEHLRDVLTMTTTWFLELAFSARSVIPRYDVKWNFEVTKMLYRSHGVRPPKLPWHPAP